jgi:hypothetical protein
MNERRIQLTLARELRSELCCAPNYTPRHWWECDVWAVMRSRLEVEFEIKLSVADFKADAKKSGYANKIGAARGSIGRTTKMDLLANCPEYGPSRFVYVIPRELEAEITPLLPDFAGLWTIDTRGSDDRLYWVVRKERPGTRRHNRKVSKGEIRLCQSRMWYRYWEALRDNDRLIYEVAR